MTTVFNSRYSPASWEIYAQALASARMAMPAHKAASVTPVDVDVPQGQAFLDLAGLSGGYISPYGELAGVFKHPRYRSIVAQDVTEYALSRGAWWLNCLGIYGGRRNWAMAGFQPVAQERWNDAKAPAGWQNILELEAKPNVVFMVHENFLPKKWDGHVATVDSFEEAYAIVQVHNPHPTGSPVFLGGVINYKELST